MCDPFHELGLGPMEVLLQVVNDDRRPTMPDEMPPLFADLVVRCWATDARERPNFAAIVAELETFAELSGFGTIPVPKAFNPPQTVSAELERRRAAQPRHSSNNVAAPMGFDEGATTRHPHPVSVSVSEPPSPSTGGLSPGGVLPLPVGSVPFH